jgi:carbamate kinase
MRPKAEAAARFVEQTGGFAAIGALGDVARLMRGDGGTRVIGVPR